MKVEMKGLSNRKMWIYNWETVELNHKPNLIPKRGTMKKIIQLVDG